MTRVAAIQMVSSADLQANLQAARELLRDARGRGARVAVLPENFAFMGRDELDKLTLAEIQGDGPIQGFVADVAKELDLWIVAGTIPLRSESAKHVAASCLVFDAQGRIVVRYDKIHLFDVRLPNRDEHYQESATVEAGSSPVCVDTPAGRLGL